MTPRVIASAEELQAVVRRLGAEVSAAYPAGVLLVAVLKGSIPFLADLVRRLHIPCEVDFLAISPFGDTGRVRLIKDLEQDVGGRDVLVVEDIVDTGLTLTWLLAELGSRRPRSLEVCALFDKGARRIVPTPIRFRGLEVGDEFLLGYGLDFDGRYRNLRQVVAGDLEALRADPGAHLKDLYAG